MPKTRVKFSFLTPGHIKKVSLFLSGLEKVKIWLGARVFVDYGLECLPITLSP